MIKVEQPGRGDPVRGQGVIKDGLSWYFAQFNRNKQSITLDLYQDEGKRVLADLLRRADVLVENFRPGVLERMGFPESHLRELNPGLVVASINGYGSSGPYADRPAFDFIAQAMSGFMSVTGPAAASRCAPGRRSAIWSPGSMPPSAWSRRCSPASAAPRPAASGSKPP